MLLITHDPVDLAVVKRLARAEDWHPPEGVPSDPADGMEQTLIWEAGDGTITLVYETDEAHDTFRVDVLDPVATSSAIRSAVPCHNADEIVQIALSASTSQEAEEAFYLLGLAADDVSHRADLEKILKRYIVERDPDCWIRAVGAARRLRWRQLKPAIEELAADQSFEDHEYCAMMVRLTTWDRG